MGYAIAGVGGFVAGGFLVWLYKNKVISDYEKAASTAGLIFQKVSGKVTALRKAL